MRELEQVRRGHIPRLFVGHDSPMVRSARFGGARVKVRGLNHDPAIDFLENGGLEGSGRTA